MKYNFMKIAISMVFVSCFSNFSTANAYWQQRVEYTMEVDFDVKQHQFSGSQKLTYFNNSPDTLRRVFYHLYFNAFQPESMMDVRSRNLEDPDYRVLDKIAGLSPEEIGYQRVLSLKQDGKPLSYEVVSTVLEVELSEPILPGASVVFEMEFEGQVPVQIRRSGRHSFEGVDYSMAQWFPKMAAYDKMGWHAHPYVAREFYAPWGDYDVKITIDKRYVVAGTGILQNPNETGYGYEDEGVKVNRKGKKLTWHFKAENVHDFVWAADPEYVQTTAQVPDGPLLRFFYIPGEKTSLWEQLPSYTVKAFEFAEKNYGKYGWSEYAIIQGGDGGMEYPMATLIANENPNSGVRSLESLVGVVIHELMHSWYQGMLAFNESYYSWMDEGFTSYASAYVEQHVFNKDKRFPLENSYKSYIKWANSGLEEPMSTHADRFDLNSAYSVAAYIKGAVSVEQLGYIIGYENLSQGLLRFKNEWEFKHPDLNDFIRVMEKQSGLELHWYYEDWAGSTRKIDYAVTEVKSKGSGTQVSLKNAGKLPMPLDVYITKKDGSQQIYYIPLGIMRGEKPNETSLTRIVGRDWYWTHPTYSFDLEIPYESIEKIEIDPSGRLADVDRSNNTFTTTGSEESAGN